MNLNYHIYHPDIKCPYCDVKYYDDNCYVSQQLETKIELECDNCNKKFWAEACIVFNTHSDCKLNNKEHDLEETHISNFFNCKNCSQFQHNKISEEKE